MRYFCRRFARKRTTRMKDYRLDHLILSQFKEGLYEFDFALDTSYFQAVEKTELLGGNVQAHAQLTIRHQDYSLRMTLNGEVQVACDRCLEPMTIPVQHDEVVETDQEPTIDLLWLAYEIVIVNLPTVHCHPEGGCNPEMAALLQSHLSSTEEEPEDI